jgi:hypothetical protein
MHRHPDQTCPRSCRRYTSTTTRTCGRSSENAPVRWHASAWTSSSCSPGARVVLEIDGAQHYSIDGTADPKRYADMVAEDRALRLARYGVYRFGGHELAGKGPAEVAKLNSFFDHLLALHRAT